MLMPASSSSDRLNPTAGRKSFAPLGYTGRGGRRRCQGLLAIAKNWCQSFLSHIARSRVSGTQDALTLNRSDAPTSLAVASRGQSPFCRGYPLACTRVYDTTWAASTTDWGNISAVVRKRNYHVGGKAGYRM